MLAHIYYYAKSYYAALATGVLYLTTVIGPDIQFGDLAHVSLLHWFGFVGSVLGVSAGVAVITNGAKATQASTDAQLPQLTTDPAPVNVVNVAPAPEVTAPVVIAPEVAPAETPAQ
jgi:hypothetical protein